MPLKSHRHTTHKKHPKHYAKVYWPYLPLLLVLGLSLFIGQSLASRSQTGVLSYATEISRTGLLEATNTQRNQVTAPTLELNSKLNQAAQAKAEDMVARNYWSHTSPDNQLPWAFIEKAKYSYQKAGENLAYGFATNSETVNGWMNSASHRKNILDTAYSQVGFGIAQSPDFIGNGPETVIVALYARPSSAPRLAVADTKLVPDAEQPVTSTSQLIVEPSVKAVSKIQSMTSTTIPGISFAIGLLIGAGLMYLLAKHALGVKRALRDGEKFVMKHPVLDLTIVSTVALLVLLSQSVGVIR